MAELIYSATNSMQGFHFVQILSNIFYLGISGHWSEEIACFYLILWKSRRIGHFFPCISWSSICLPLRNVKLYCSFSNWIVHICFCFLLSCLSSLCTLDINPLPYVQLVNICSCSVGHLFTLDSFLCCAETVDFHEIPLVHFWFCFLCFGDLI